MAASSKLTLHELLAVLDQIVNLLRSQDETHWADWRMARSAQLLRKGDGSGLQHLLAA